MPEWVQGKTFRFVPVTVFWNEAQDPCAQSSKQLTQFWKMCTGIPTTCCQPKNKEDICYLNCPSAMTRSYVQSDDTVTNLKKQIICDPQLKIS